MGTVAGTVAKKESFFFLDFPAKSFYLCSVKRKNDFSNRSIPSQNKE